MTTLFPTVMRRSSALCARTRPAPIVRSAAERTIRAARRARWLRYLRLDVVMAGFLPLSVVVPTIRDYFDGLGGSADHHHLIRRRRGNHNGRRRRRLSHHYRL